MVVYRGGDGVVECKWLDWYIWLWRNGSGNMGVRREDSGVPEF